MWRIFGCAESRLGGELMLVYTVWDVIRGGLAILVALILVWLWFEKRKFEKR